MLTTNVILKSLTPLLLALPVGGYAVGSLAASSSDDDTPRQTIQLEQAGPASGAPAAREAHQRPARHAGTREEPAEPAAAEPAAPAARPDESGEVDGGSDDSTSTSDGDRVETIVPQYDESGESEGPEADDEATTTTDEGDDQGDDRSAEHDSDRRGDHGDDSDQDGGGD